MSKPDPSDPTEPPHGACAHDVLAALVETLPVGLAIGRPDGRPVYANGMAARHGLVDRGPGGLGPAGRGPAGLPSSEPANKDIAVETSRLTVGGRDYVVRLSRDVAAQRSLEDTLFRKAYFDELTGLPNRGLVEQSVADLIEHGRGEAFALAFLDLDNFKQINDYYGHGAGDDLLVKLGRRMQAEMRDTDLIGRVGGDEFLLLLSPAESAPALLARCDAILHRLRDPFFIAGHEVFVSASMGVSLYPDHGTDHATLCAHADLAMYRMKGAGKAGVNLFDPAIGDAALERVALEQRLRLAIRDRRLCCVFQPKVDFRSSEVVGLEVLLRWRDEQGVIQPPGEIIALATDLGLMDEITHTLLGQAIGAIDRIDAVFGPAVTISVNIAARQAGHVRFMTSIADAIAASGSAGRFMLELTEEAFLNKNAFQATVLPVLRERGIKVSIDDFGTGYSSLSALADITADEIKVDRSFITDIHRRPRNQVILKAVESLGQALDMSVIVEGVETFEELAYLQAATQIRFAQGFYFAQPMLLDELKPSTTLVDRHLVPARTSGLQRQTARRGR